MRPRLRAIRHLRRIEALPKRPLSFGTTTMGAVPMGTSTIAGHTRDLVAEINDLRAEHGAAILAHNYQIPDIQDVADVVADSLPLARQADRHSGPERRMLARRDRPGRRRASLACRLSGRHGRGVREHGSSGQG